MIQTRALGDLTDIRGGLKIDLNRGGPPKTEKRPFHSAFEDGLLGKDANSALNHEDEVLVRHSGVGFPRWDAEGEALPRKQAPRAVFKVEGGHVPEDLSSYLDEALDYDGHFARRASPQQASS